MDNNDGQTTVVETPAAEPTGTLGVTNPEQAAKMGWAVRKGDPGMWECISKADNEALGIFKSTKRLRVAGGFLYQVTTEKFDNERQYLALAAEALAFVPDPAPAPVVNVTISPGGVTVGTGGRVVRAVKKDARKAPKKAAAKKAAGKRGR